MSTHRDWNEFAETQGDNQGFGFAAGVAAALGYSDTIGEGMPYPDGWEDGFDELCNTASAARRANLWHSYAGNGLDTRPLAASSQREWDAACASFVVLMRAGVTA